MFTVVCPRCRNLIMGDGGHNCPVVDEAKGVAPRAPWHFDAATKARANEALQQDPQQSFVLIPAASGDIEKVTASYLRAPVPGYSVKAIYVIYNPRLNRAFGLNLDLLNERQKSPQAFAPKWKQLPGEEGAHREATYQVLQNMAAPHADPDHPHLLLVPLWHATNADILPSLFSAGFAALATVDEGFFGRGLYSTGEARYAQGVYGKMYKRSALLMNWVAAYSAYPVIDGDMGKLIGKAAYANHDAHFIPVVPQDPNDPNEQSFYPCKPGQAHQYTEMVVFEKAQCLPRYVVELQPDLIPPPRRSSQDLNAMRAEWEAKEAQMKERIVQNQMQLHQFQQQLQAEQSAYIKALAEKQAEMEMQSKIIAEQSQKIQAFHHQAALSPAVAGPVEAKEGLSPRSLGISPNDLQRFLLLVVEGEQDEAETMLQQNSRLALASGSVTDLSTRRFASITAFQYAVWAMDWHMWTMILKYLPTDAAALQMKLLEKNGTEHGKHFNLQTLINALDTYIKNHSSWSVAQCGIQWCQKIGGAQLMLPAHVVNEYCYPRRTFDPVPDFTQSSLPRIRRVHVNTLNDDWFSVQRMGGLVGSSDFAFYRGGWKRACGGGWGIWALFMVTIGTGTLIADHASLQKLKDTREKQLRELKFALFQNIDPTLIEF